MCEGPSQTPSSQAPRQRPSCQAANALATGREPKHEEAAITSDPRPESAQKPSQRGDSQHNVTRPMGRNDAENAFTDGLWVSQVASGMKVADPLCDNLGGRNAALSLGKTPPVALPTGPRRQHGRLTWGQIRPDHRRNSKGRGGRCSQQEYTKLGQASRRTNKYDDKRPCLQMKPRTNNPGKGRNNQISATP